MWWLLLCVVLQCVHSVRIIHMRVPEVIQYGTKDSVTLDCEYVTNNVTGLVVKWFFMDRAQPVYQWIPPQKPQALGILRNKDPWLSVILYLSKIWQISVNPGNLDLSHRVSQNPYTQHRALRILSPGTELSGNYTCVVSTFLAEDEKTRPMTIFIPEKSFTMIQDRLDDDYLNIICSVEGVYPRPDLTVLVGNRPLVTKSTTNLINGRYTALASSVVRVDSLPPTVEVLCEMQVPDANYLSRKRHIFYRDPPPTSPEPPNSPDNHIAPDSGNIKSSSATLTSLLLIVNYLLWNIGIIDTS